MRARLILLVTALITLSIALRCDASVRFSLDGDSTTLGEKPRVTFDAPLPRVPGERYWITITRPELGNSRPRMSLIMLRRMTR